MITKTKTDSVKLEITQKALQAVLLFHSASPWNDEKRQKWDSICREVMPKAFNHYGLYDRTHGFDATTKMLCDVARAALDQANDQDHSCLTTI